MNYFRERLARLFLSLRSSLPTTANAATDAQSIELASTAITTVIVGIPLSSACCGRTSLTVGALEPPIPTINARFRWIGRRGCLGRRPNQGWDNKQHVEHATARSHDDHNVSLLSKALRFVNSLFSTLYSYIFLLQLSATHRWRIVRLIDAREKPGSEERWESFKARMTLEWQVIVTACGVFLAVAISLMQIPDIMANPLTNALNWVTMSCTCGLFVGFIYLVHFSSLETTQSGRIWLRDAERRKSSKWRSAPMLLCIPAACLLWGIIVFVACAISYIWRGDPARNSTFPPLATRVCVMGIMLVVIAHAIAVVLSLWRMGVSDKKNEEDGEGDADRESAVDADRI